MFDGHVLNDFMALSHKHWSEARATIRKLLTDESISLPESSLIPMSTAKMHLPAAIGDYTDFYSSICHATNVGTMFRYVLHLVITRTFDFRVRPHPAQCGHFLGVLVTAPRTFSAL